MSKARLVITAVIVEGRTQSEAAATYGVSKGWVSKLLARYRLEGETACQPRSRRPHHTPRATPPATIDLILTLRARLTGQGLDAGADTIGWHLMQHHDVTVSRATIHRILTRAAAVTQSRPNDPSPPTSASRQTNQTSAGNRTSRTTGWPTAPTPRS